MAGCTGTRIGRRGVAPSDRVLQNTGVEEWRPDVTVPPRACFVCHAGTQERAGWWQWDWDYVLETEETGRLQICDVCLTAAATAPGGPFEDARREA